MIEIRTIAHEEGETFLELLCGVFELDFHRAESIFFTEPMFDLERKWALFEDGEMVSILTTVPLEFGWGRAFGVAGVATVEAERGRGLAGKLLDYVCLRSAERGETAAYLFAKEPGVYAKNGFVEVDRVLHGTVIGCPEERGPRIMENAEVIRVYEEWALAGEDRLRRDERRWNYWKWNFRMCSALPDGYMCLEGNTLREAIVSRPRHDWPVGRHTEWSGLVSMARRLGLELRESKIDLYLMARGTSRVPQMFLTDQF